MIFINFKTYPEATDENAVKLAKACGQAQKNIKIPIHLLIQASDIAQVKKEVSLPIWAQHIDPIKAGQATGFVTALAIKKDGAIGSMLNHSEHPLGFGELRNAVKEAKNQSLKTLVCVKSLEEGTLVKELRSDYVAFEDPQLIGSGISMVSSEKGQKELKEFVKLGFSFPIVGAGIGSVKDAKKSLELGAKGVLVSSAVVKADNPQKVLEELASGF